MAERSTGRGDGPQHTGLLRRVVALRWPVRSRRDDRRLRHWPDDVDVTLPPTPGV